MTPEEPVKPFELPSRLEVFFRVDLAVRGFPVGVLAIAALFLMTVTQVVSRSGPLGVVAWVGAIVEVLLVLLLMVAMRLPRRLAVRDDGIVLAHMGRSRFIPFEAIDGAVPTADDILAAPGLVTLLLNSRSAEPLPAEYVRGIVLLRKNGSRERIVTAFVPSTAVERDLRRSDLLGAILRGLAAHARIDGVPTVATFLGRGNASAREWRAQAERCVAPDDAFRSVAVSREELWRVATDPASAEDTRVGAVLALRASLDDEERERVRVVIASHGSPKLRVALEAVIDPETDEAHLDEALDSIGR